MTDRRPPEPFLPADDLDETERSQFGADSEPPEDAFELDDSPATLEGLRQEMRKGFRRLRGSMDALGQRVVKLEADAAWKRWALGVARATVPFVAGYFAHRYPELAKHLPELERFLNGIGGP